jgi:SAM-dependent methyltransferase
VNATEAATLIAGAVPPSGGPRHGMRVWADLGAGAGTFTEALAGLLDPGAQLYAVDRERRAIAALERLAASSRSGATIIPRRADFAEPAGLDGLALPPLDGILLANALHFVSAADQAAVLARLVARLRPGGRLVVVEYDGRGPSPWVPWPVSPARLRALLPAGVGPLRQVGSRPSAYGGVIYAAVAECDSGP